MSLQGCPGGMAGGSRVGGNRGDARAARADTGAAETAAATGTAGAGCAAAATIAAAAGIGGKAGGAGSGAELVPEGADRRGCRRAADAGDRTGRGRITRPNRGLSGAAGRKRDASDTTGSSARGVRDAAGAVGRTTQLGIAAAIGGEPGGGGAGGNARRSWRADSPHPGDLPVLG